MLKIAIQKIGGRLYPDSQKFLENVGFGFTLEPGKLSTKTWDHSAQIFFLRTPDILTKIEQGILEIGILGLNLLAEEFTQRKFSPPEIFSQKTHSQIKPVCPLEFGKCRLVLAAPKLSKIKKLADFHQKKIATSYPQLTQTFLRAHKIQPAKIITLAGSVEIAPESGEADAIADLVESGRTLATHNLQEIHEIFTSQAYLVANQKFAQTQQGQKVLAAIQTRLAALRLATDKKYLMLNCTRADLPKIEKILPAAVSPTVLPLAKKDQFAIHSVASEKEFWQTLPDLKKAGARDILLLNVEKLIY